MNDQPKMKDWKWSDTMNYASCQDLLQKLPAAKLPEAYALLEKMVSEAYARLEELAKTDEQPKVNFREFL